MKDDVISRQAAIDAVLGVIPYDEYWKEQIEKAVNELPPVQPEIVRCEECKYAHITYGGEVKYCDIWFPDESHYIDTDNYCSFAERRTDEQTD